MFQLMANQTIQPNHHLELVKAAAWAWYEHSEGKPMTMREFDVTRTQRPPRPSRYKLEAMRNNDTNNMETEMEGSIRSNNKHSLLDEYEIECISKRLDHLIGLSGIKFYEELLRIDSGAVDDQPKKKRSSSRGGDKLKRFLLRRGSVVCGRNHDVDETAFKPRKYGAVIKTVNCRPRAPSADVW